MAVKIDCPVPPYCTAKGLVRATTPDVTVIGAVPVIIPWIVEVERVFPPLPQAEPVVVKSPPPPACTQLPLVKLVTERLVVVAVVITELEAFIVVPEKKVIPKTLELRVMFGVSPPEDAMLPEPVTAVTKRLGVVVATIIPLGSVAKVLPKMPGKNDWPVVVALVNMLDVALRLVVFTVVAL